MAVAVKVIFSVTIEKVTGTVFTSSHSTVVLSHKISYFTTILWELVNTVPVTFSIVTLEMACNGVAETSVQTNIIRSHINNAINNADSES